jgi:hypothetical protein
LDLRPLKEVAGIEVGQLLLLAEAMLFLFHLASQLDQPTPLAGAMAPVLWRLVHSNSINCGTQCKQ